MITFCAGEGGDPATNPNPKGGLGYICHQDHDFLYGKEQWNVVYLDLSDLDLCVEGENCDGALIADGRDDDLCERLVDEDNGNFPMEIVPAKEKDPPGCTDPPDPYCLDDEDGNVGRLSSYYIVLHESNDEHCTWDRNLEKTSCKVRIALRGYFHNESSGTKSGRLVGLNAWGHVIPAPFVKGKPTEINPFTRHQDIKIEELTVYFRGIGTNRTVASCYYDNRVYLDDEIVPGKFLNEDIVFRTTCVGKGCNTPSQ